MLKIDNITIAYKDVPTVMDFSLHMAQGQIVSLVGESGSGKTTVIRAVLGLLAGGGKVTKGDILFNGTSLLSNTPEQWRKLRGSEISMICRPMRRYPKRMHGQKAKRCLERCVFQVRIIL